MKAPRSTRKTDPSRRGAAATQRANQALAHRLTARAIELLKRESALLAKWEPDPDDPIAKKIITQVRREALLAQIASGSSPSIAAEECRQALMEGDTSFCAQVDRAARRGGKPMFEPLDWQILLHWDFVADPQKSTLPKVAGGLKNWTDQAAAEFLNFKLGTFNATNAVAYRGRRKRMGLRPEQPVLVRSARYTWETGSNAKELCAQICDARDGCDWKAGDIMRVYAWHTVHNLWAARTKSAPLLSD